MASSRKQKSFQQRKQQLLSHQEVSECRLQFSEFLQFLIHVAANHTAVILLHLMAFYTAILINCITVLGLFTVQYTTFLSRHFKITIDQTDTV